MNNYLMPLASGSRVKFGQFSEVKREIGNDNVVREDQEYVIMVKYDFIGTGELGNIILERKMESIKRILPLGFSAERLGYRYSWGEDDDNYQLLFLVIAIIFIICSVLLESFRQPLAVISLIPFSFIGVFLTFHLFKLPFDEGGFAAFLLLSGLVVNSALYIINDYNNLIKKFPNKPGIKLYVKAYHTKIVPILLTILSTVVGLLPFLLAGKDERFWFPLAAGTIGGLVFSVLGLLFLLPVINRHLIRVNMDPATFKKRKKKSHG
jgi:multidrug efflux pump subunit AcrB